MAVVEKPASGLLDNPELTGLGNIPLTRFEDKTYNAGSLQVFTISFIDGTDDTKKFFNFALLPAIETSANKGQGGVPEVKPGVVTMTNMRYKNFLIPGSTPVVQSIGVQSTVHQFVGAFIGSENISDTATRATMDFVYPLVGTDPPWTNVENSFNKANMFDKKVVQVGRPITMKLSSDVEYTYEGVIVNFKFYAVKAERAYYTLDLMGTVYHKQKPPLSSSDYITDGSLKDPNKPEVFGPPDLRGVPRVDGKILTFPVPGSTQTPPIAPLPGIPVFNDSLISLPGASTGTSIPPAPPAPKK